jgi:hypothetical protein
MRVRSYMLWNEMNFGYEVQGHHFCGNGGVNIIFSIIYKINILCLQFSNKYYFSLRIQIKAPMKI